MLVAGNLYHQRLLESAVRCAPKIDPISFEDDVLVVIEKKRDLDVLSDWPFNVQCSDALNWYVSAFLFSMFAEGSLLQVIRRKQPALKAKDAIEVFRADADAAAAVELTQVQQLTVKCWGKLDAVDFAVTRSNVLNVYVASLRGTV